MPNALSELDSRSPSVVNARKSHCKPVKNKSRVYMKCKLVTRLIHGILSPSIGVDIRKKQVFYWCRI